MIRVKSKADLLPIVVVVVGMLLVAAGSSLPLIAPPPGHGVAGEPVPGSPVATAASTSAAPSESTAGLPESSPDIWSFPPSETAPTTPLPTAAVPGGTNPATPGATELPAARRVERRSPATARASASGLDRAAIPWTIPAASWNNGIGIVRTSASAICAVDAIGAGGWEQHITNILVENAASNPFNGRAAIASACRR
jgi:hypothetical protein